MTKKSNMFIFIIIILILNSLFAEGTLYTTQKNQIMNNMGNYRISTDSNTGKVRFIGTDISDPIIHPQSFIANTKTAEEAAREFILGYDSILGIDNQNDKLSLTSDKKLDDGRSIVRFQQTKSGTPIFGGEILVQLNPSNDILAVNNKIISNINIDMNPKITKEDAKQTAISIIAKYHDIDKTNFQATQPELWIYNPTTFNIDQDEDILVWRTEIMHKGTYPIKELVLVDAHTGKLALHFNQIADAKYRLIYDHANNDSKTIPSNIADLKRSEGQGATGITEVDKAYDYSGDTYDFYYEHFGRDGINDSGMNITITVRYCEAGEACPYENAYWTDGNQQMVFGDGFVTDDIMGHELTHGVTSYESGLFYYMQSGSINEALSDIFGEFIDITNGAGNDSAEARWLMGEDTSFSAFRSMKNPTEYGNPDKMSSADYYCGLGDNGGVHYNMGVGSKAAYLLTDGDTFNGYNITGIGLNKTAQLFYEAQTNLLISGSDYADLYDILIQAAINLGFNSSERREVEKTINATEMNQETVCTITEAPLCETGTLNNIFFDDLENIISNKWVSAAINGTNSWFYPQNPNIYDYDFTYTTSGIYNIWGDDPNGISDSYIQMNVTASLVEGVENYLHFKHAFSFEYSIGTCWDGGVIEYSIDTGNTWIDAGNLTINNGYNSIITNISGNPLGNRDAFCYTTLGYSSSRINLTSLAGEDIMIRFRIGTDESAGYWGWFIDDIRIYACEDVIAPSITLNTPTNMFNASNTTIIFNGTISDNINLTNVTLYGIWLGWHANETNSSGMNDSNYIFTKTLDDGTYLWNYYACDNSSNCAFADTNYSFTIDTIYPMVTFLNSTEDNNSVFSRDWIYSSITLSENSKNVTWNINGTKITYDNLTYRHNETSLNDGTFTYNVTACDYSGNCNSTENRVIVLDTTPPYFDPMPSNQIIDYNEKFTYNVNASDNLFFANFSINDTTNFHIYNNGTIINKTRLDMGTYHINISINDTTGNKDSRKISVAVKLIRSINISANASTDVSLEKADSNLTIYLKGNVSMNLVASKVTATANGTTTSLKSLKGIDISVDSSTHGNLSWAIIKIYYSESELTAANIEESSLKIYYYNETSDDWILEANQGIDTTNNFIWVNVTHLSMFNVFGTAPVAPVQSSGGGGGGGSCTSQWVCSDWNKCIDGTQTRICTDIRCHRTTRKPIEEQICTCEEFWICDSWSDCKEDNTQIRDCEDMNSCGTTELMPPLTTACKYDKPESKTIEDNTKTKTKQPIAIESPKAINESIKDSNAEINKDNDKSSLPIFLISIAIIAGFLASIIIAHKKENNKHQIRKHNHQKHRHIKR